MKKAFTLGILFATLSLSMVSGLPVAVDTGQYPAINSANANSIDMIQTIQAAVIEPVVFTDTAPAEAVNAIVQEAIYAPPGSENQRSLERLETKTADATMVESTQPFSYPNLGNRVKNGYITGA